jgi:hypothetical protein
MGISRYSRPFCSMLKRRRGTEQAPYDVSRIMAQSSTGIRKVEKLPTHVNSTLRRVLQLLESPRPRILNPDTSNGLGEQHFSNRHSSGQSYHCATVRPVFSLRIQLNLPAKT